MSEPLQPSELNPPGSSVHSILQTRILEWVVIPSSKPFSPVPPALQVDSLPLSHQGTHLSVFIEAYNLEIYQKNRTSRIHTYIIYVYI